MTESTRVGTTEKGTHMTDRLTPADIIENSVVDRLRYWLTEDGRVHVSGVPGIGQRVLDELSKNGYAIRNTHHSSTEGNTGHG